MSVSDSTLQEAVANALDSATAATAGDAVHEVVARHFERLDPFVKVRKTEYFNHSFVPDLSLTWKDNSSGVKTREVYLRHSLDSAIAGRDIRDLGDQGEPIFISLASADSPKSVEIVERQASNHRHAMISTTPALGRFGPASASRDPVSQVVRANIARSGRGVIASETADRLILPVPAEVREETLVRFSDAVASSFSEDAVVRISRISAIVAAALSNDETNSALGGELSGRFSKAEAQALIPYLLSLDGATEDTFFWRSVGELLTLEDIESLASELDGLDLTRLARPCMHVWMARRAQLALRPDEEEGNELQWRMRAGRLSANVGSWSVYLASTGDKLRTRSADGVQGRWEADLRAGLRGFKVTDVRLSGLSREVAMSNEGAAGAASDVDEVLALWDDSFHVPAVTVQVGSDDTAASVELSFAKMLATASPRALCGDLVSATVNVLGYRQPTADADLRSLVPGDISSPEGGDPIPVSRVEDPPPPEGRS